MKINGKSIWALFLTGIISLLLIDSDFFTYLYSDKQHDDSKVKSSSTKLSHDFKHIDVNLVLSDSLSRAMIMRNMQIDSVVVEERRLMQEELIATTQPCVVSIDEEHNMRFDSIHTLVIVDLTLSQSQIEAQKNALTILHRSTFNDNLHVKFAGDGELSELTLVTDYVLENMFVPKRKENYLLRNIVTEYDMIRYDSIVHYGSVGSWADIPNKDKLLLVFSDEETYRNGYPIDYYNYTLQQEMHKIGLEIIEDPSKRVPFYYISFNDTDPSERDDIDIATKLRLKNLCTSTGGNYFDEFDYSEIFENVRRLQKISNINCTITLENPDFKMYAGSMMNIRLVAYSGGDELFEEHIIYSLGHLYDPIFINYKPTSKIKINGIIFAIIIFLIAYIVLQIIYPFLMYQFVFKRKYVTKYTDQYSVYDNNIVDQHCNYCKEKLVKGDQIVIKCKHTTHLSCWEENKYKCPEYGEKCKDGAFYYNRDDIFDVKNAPYITSWVLNSIITALVIWLSYFAIKSIEMPFIDGLYMDSLRAIDSLGFSDEVLASNTSSGRYLYKYGFNICFWISMILGIQASWGSRIKYKRVMQILMPILCGLGGAFTFFVLGIVLTPTSAYNNMLFGMLILWMTNSALIYMCASYATRMSFKKMMLSLFTTTFLAIITLAVVAVYCGNKLESFYIQLLFNLVYCLGFSIAFAFVLPRSKRYFLRVDWARKPIDIALFKWFNSQNNVSEVNVGRSIDCDIFMDWDLDTSIEAIHAKIEKEGRFIKLTPIGAMKIDGKDAKIGRKYTLNKRVNFTIGKSTFTYIEKDFYYGK